MGGGQIMSLNWCVRMRGGWDKFMQMNKIEGVGLIYCSIIVS